MLTRVTVLETLETYYDTVPRAAASAEEAGHFTLFVKTEPTGWPYYARPRLGGEVPFTASAVDAVRERQRDLGVPEALEWVHETTPTLLSAARESGLHVHECPLLVLPEDADPKLPALPDGLRVDMLAPDSPTLGAVLAAVGAGFAGSDEVTPRDPGSQPRTMERGLLAVAGAYDGQGPVGGGSHSPRGTTTELAGIAVVPRARRLGVGAAITHTLVEDAPPPWCGDGVPLRPGRRRRPGLRAGRLRPGRHGVRRGAPGRLSGPGRPPYCAGSRRVAHEHPVGR